MGCMARKLPALTEEEVDNRIERWHTGASTMPLYEYLGWTWEQYAHWVETEEIPAPVVQ